MKKILLGFLLIGFQQLSAQLNEMEVRKIAAKGNLSQWVSTSTTLFTDDQLSLAEILVDKLLEVSPDNSNYNYKKGYIFLYFYNDYEKAIPFFIKATGSVSQNVDWYSTSEKSSPYDAYFHLAKCYHSNAEIERAKQYYNQFLFKVENKSELVKIAHTYLLQCDIAQNLMKKPKKTIVKNLGEEINSKNAEFSPVVSLDGSSIYFTSKRPWVRGESDVYRDPITKEYTEDIYLSFIKSDSSWSKPERLAFCLPDRNEATVAVSGDEKRIYVYQDDNGGGDLYFSDFSKNEFGEIHSLFYPGVNTEYWETHSTMTIDGQNIYFVSDRPGGFGGRDIYRIVKLPNGEWSLPQNLGPGINTEFDEDAPFIASDNKTLFFSSNGPRSMGGFDVFYSVRNEDNVWGDPINLGFPINSTLDDIYYTTTLDGLRSYITSSRKGGYGEKDIYEIQNDYNVNNQIAALKGNIITVGGVQIPEGLSIQIACLNCEDVKVSSTTPRLRDGAFFSSLLEHCRDYEYVIKNGDNQVLYRDTVSTLCESTYHEIYREVLVDVEQMKVVSSLDPKEEKRKAIEKEKEIFAQKEKERIELGLKETSLQVKEKGKFKELELYYYFGYNGNKLVIDNPELRKFIRELEAEVKKGRKNIVITIESSASYVPIGKSFKSNEALADARANNLEKELNQYILKNKLLKDKVQVKIVASSVNGPTYANDALDIKKYQKYQFVHLKTR